MIPRFTLLSVCLVLFVTGRFCYLVGQSLLGPNANLGIRYDPLPEEFSVTWTSKPNHFYFLLTTADLQDDPWAYFDYAVLGDGDTQGVILSSSADALFFRVEYTNDPNAAVLKLDHDGDKVATADELVQGSDPFLSQSLDADTIPDDWETFHGLNTSVGNDSSENDLEPDGANALTEYTFNLDPNRRDHPDLALKLF